ncbi:MAG: hypothetical protein PGN16_04055 [Sphingomonas phyllosphaerae]
MLSFDELCSQFHATAEERDALAWHLAMFRARKTYDALRAVEKGEAK